MAVHRRGDPVGVAVASDVPHRLPRSGVDAAGSRRGGRSHDDFPLDPECPGNNQAFQFRRRRSQAQEALPELHHLQIVVLQVRHDLVGEGAVIADFADVEAGGEGEDLMFDEREIRGVSRRGGQQPLCAPDVVSHPVPPGAAEDGCPPPGPRTASAPPSVCRSAMRRIFGGREQQREGGQIVDPRQIQPTETGPPGTGRVRRRSNPDTLPAYRAAALRS
jgi:hypothetical protein